MLVSLPATRPSVLVIDSDTDNREMYCEALTWLGFSVRGARSAVEAINHIVEDEPCVIVTETSLRGMSGYRLLELLQDSALTRQVPVIAVTASAYSHDLARAAAAGFTTVLTKPCLPETLATAIHGLCEPQQASGLG